MFNNRCFVAIVVAIVGATVVAIGSFGRSSAYRRSQHPQFAIAASGLVGWVVEGGLGVPSVLRPWSW